MVKMTHLNVLLTLFPPPPLSLGALPVDLALARLIVLLSTDPHLLEAAQGPQDGTPDPGPESGGRGGKD